MYLLAIILPPLAVLLKGRPITAFLNLLLTICFWIPGAIHAMMVISNDRANSRHKELVSAVREGADK